MSASVRPLFVPDTTLDPAVRRLAIGLLGARLADAVDLGTQARQAQWNVKGTLHQALRMLFDGIHDAVDDYGDLLAERVVQLGGVAFGTARQAAARSTLTEYPAVVDGSEHLLAMTAALAQLGARMHDAVDQTAGWGDTDSADICAEVSRGLQKWLWMIQAHGGDRPTVVV